MPKLARVVPTDKWHLVLEFADGDVRVFDASIARTEFDWPELAYPMKLKNLTFTEDGVGWPGGRTLDAGYLFDRSTPVSGRALESQVLRLSYQNQAPTEQDQRHHVYCVYLYPFGPKAFDVGESIGGGHGERGGSFRFDLQELLAYPQWQRHFELSGAGWAVPMIEAGQHDERALLDTLVREICRRAGRSPVR